MKIISLNTWMGTVFEPLMAFVEAQAATTDVFCFQEMMSALEEGKHVTSAKGRRVNLLQELEGRLPEFEVHAARTLEDYDTDIMQNGRSWLGDVVFVRKTVPCIGSEVFLFGESPHPITGVPFKYGGLFVDLQVNGTPVRVFSLHAFAFPGNKLDSPDRLVQSRQILDLAMAAPGEVIVMGDFNLMPETESIRMFAQAGFRNLITDFQIPTTRGTLHKELHPEWGKPPFEWQEFADYTFVSPGVKMKSFAVPDEPISDHLPMVLECEVGVSDVLK